MIWWAPSNHRDDCYFCVIPNLHGFNKKYRKCIQYLSVPSAVWPTPLDKHIPVPIFKGLLEEDNCESSTGSTSSDEYEISDEEFDSSCTVPQRFNQAELSDLLRDLNLSKESSEVLVSRLKEKNLLESGTLVTYYRNQDAEFSPFFRRTRDLVCFSYPERVLFVLGVGQYNASDWRLFIDSSKQSLKCVLLHNTNEYASIPIENPTILKEKHEPSAFEKIQEVIEKINYAAHNWKICVDLKAVNFLLGLQSGCTKHPCLLCSWNSRTKHEHWVTKDWPSRQKMTVGENKVLYEPLVPCHRIIFSPLHRKLELMAQFAKEPDREVACFEYIWEAFLGVTIEKPKNGIFDGPDIRKTLKRSELYY